MALKRIDWIFLNSNSIEEIYHTETKAVVKEGNANMNISSRTLLNNLLVNLKQKCWLCYIWRQKPVTKVYCGVWISNFYISTASEEAGNTPVSLLLVSGSLIKWWCRYVKVLRGQLNSRKFTSHSPDQAETSQILTLIVKNDF